MSVTIDSRRFDALMSRLALRFPPSVAEAITEEARETLDNAKARTPFVTGNLRDSGRIEVGIDPAGITVEVKFGGAEAPYAVFVHEDLSAEHPIGQAKFLETAAAEQEHGFGTRVAARMRGVIR